MRVLFFRLKGLAAALAFVALLIVSSLAAHAADAQSVYWAAARSLPVYCVDRDDNKIAISFDCA